MDSVSNLLYPNIVQYYIIINVDNIETIYYEVITGQRKINKNNHEFMTIIEDNGLNETFETVIVPDIGLMEYNTIYFVPVHKETNLIETIYLFKKYFSDYGNNDNDNDNNYNAGSSVIYFIFIIFMLLGVVVVIICYYRRKRRLEINDVQNQRFINENY